MNGMKPTRTIPSSSAIGGLNPSSTTILRKKSPLFRKGKVSYASFSAFGMENALCT